MATIFVHDPLNDKLTAQQRGQHTASLVHGMNENFESYGIDAPNYPIKNRSGGR